MSQQLDISFGQHSDRGRKATNQDSHGLAAPAGHLRRSKGIAVAVADGIGSSGVSHVASAAAVQSFLSDYFSTPETWSVRRSAQRVLEAANTWLHAQDQRSSDRDSGHVCTFSALVLRSSTAHLFHVGDARVYRLSGGNLERLTDDHRLHVGEGRSYLARALGMTGHVEIDYRALPVAAGDLFLLLTDGVHEHVSRADMLAIVQAHGNALDAAARALVARALAQGSADNLTAQLIRVDALPPPQADELVARLMALPLPPLPEPGRLFDGWRIVRCLHTGSRSHVYLAEDADNGRQVVIKVPSADMAQDRAALSRFLLEEWIACRVRNPHVLAGVSLSRPRGWCYTVAEFVPGQTLRQWMHAHPAPDLDSVRGIIAQVARGLQALHRLDLLHQDLRPENIMIAADGHVRIIDFGAVHVAGLAEGSGPALAGELALGAVAYAAPEYFLGEGGGVLSDQFSLGVLTYEMLTGNLPYGTALAAARSRAEQCRLSYRSLLADDRELPAWLDAVIRQAVHPLPQRRHEALSAFIHQLQHPAPATLAQARVPATLARRLQFWQRTAAALVVAVVVLALGLLRLGTG